MADSSPTAGDQGLARDFNVQEGRHPYLRFGVALVAGCTLSLLVFFATRRTLLPPFYLKVEADYSARAQLIQASLDRLTIAAETVARALGLGPVTDQQRLQTLVGALVNRESSVASVYWIPHPAVGNSVDSRYPATQASVFGSGSSPATLECLSTLAERISSAPQSPVHPVVCLERPAEGGISGRIAVAVPVMDRAAASSEDGASVPVRGFLATVFSLDQLVSHALQPTRPMGLPFELYDVTAATGDVVIFKWSARLQSASTWRSVFFERAQESRHSLRIGDRQWVLHGTPSPAYLENNHPLGHWQLLLFGLLLSLGFSAHLEAEHRKRRDLRRLNANLKSEIAERERIENRQEMLLQELSTALESVKRLEGILPICSSCKKIRDVSGTWIQLETYVSSRTEAEFTHGFCPECLNKLFPG